MYNNQLADPETAGKSDTMTTVVNNGKYFFAGLVFFFVTIALCAITVGYAVEINGKLDVLNQTTINMMSGITEVLREIEVAMTKEAGHFVTMLGPNVCVGKKPKHADAAAEDYYFNNIQCMQDNVVAALEQAGGNVTKGYVGGFNATGRVPIIDPYWKQGLCPVNVHWHLGAEHLSVGQYDEHGSGPGAHDDSHDDSHSVRQGLQCHRYDAHNTAFTSEYAWKHCKDMQVGQTYEVHWPHSAAGACGTPNQYQTPFYDGVFCMDGVITLAPLNTFKKIGVQAQVFTIVNDENYYYPDLIRGMIVDGEMGGDIARYTGSTTGTSRSNEICSRYTPITWQVDRKCHLVSASSFDKMCADMKAQRDDMTDDLHAHGAREVVAHELTANNQHN